MSNGEYYQQNEGAAMGSPVSPIVANIFMEWFENNVMTTYHTPPRLWKRYVDDTLCIIKDQEINEFYDFINQFHPAIKFTMEKEENSQLPMLDVLLHRLPNHQLKCTVYRKQTATNQYLNFQSHQPLQHKLGVYRTLAHRANTIVTQEEDKTAEIKTVEQHLSNCGFPPWLFQQARNKEKQKQLNKHIQNNQPRARHSVTLPYVQGVSETINRLFLTHGIRSHFKPQNLLRHHLVHPKDKTHDLDACGLIYYIECQNCEATYVGETERPLKIRLSEHKRPTNTSSKVQLHLKENKKHSVNWEKIKILDREQDYYDRGIKEAIHIQRHPSSLNGDQGRYDLAKVYRSLTCPPSSRGKSRDQPIM